MVPAHTTSAARKVVGQQITAGKNGKITLINQHRQKLNKKVDKHIRQYAVDLGKIEENNFTSEESNTESIKETIDAIVLEVDSLPVSKTSNEQFITSFGYVLNAEVMANRLANKALEHSITTEIPRHTEEIGQLNLEKFPYTFTSSSLLNR
ncbi:hypothetical protein K3495_g12203 [Podosphaera aphanis]|nr:hypothetical protein K3495_g12203 [Podosphaera aphanis]